MSTFLAKWIWGWPSWEHTDWRQIRFKTVCKKIYLGFLLSFQDIKARLSYRYFLNGVQYINPLETREIWWKYLAICSWHTYYYNASESLENDLKMFPRYNMVRLECTTTHGCAFVKVIKGHQWKINDSLASRYLLSSQIFSNIDTIYF